MKYVLWFSKILGILFVFVVLLMFGVHLFFVIRTNGQFTNFSAWRTVIEALEILYIKTDDDKKLLEPSLHSLTKMEDAKKYFVILDVAFLAYRDKKFDLANKLAMKSLELKEEYGRDRKYSWHTGNIIHDAHTILGLTALANGDKKSAVAHLLEAGKTTGSPQLDSFGPNMILANALIEAGESTTVIEYLKSCKRFWELDDGRLDSWIATIRGGGKPYFAQNLRSGY